MPACGPASGTPLAACRTPSAAPTPDPYAGWPAYEAALKANKKSYEAFIYPNVNHGFNNDTTPRYDKAAADLSWQRTMAFFAKHVKG